MSYGMNVNTGESISGVKHVEQSIVQILTTPIGSRVMRRDFGSVIPELIDQPLSGSTILMIYAATATAIYKWEPRFKLLEVQLNIDDLSGRAHLSLQGHIKLGSRWVNSDRLTVSIKE